MTRALLLAATAAFIASPVLAQPPADDLVTTAPPVLEDAAPQGPAEPTAAVRRAAEALQSTIAAMQAGALDPATLSPALAEAVAAQSAAITPTLVALGPVAQIEHRGAVQDAERFRVTFEGGRTDWFIALDDAGIITALVFREAD